MALTAVPIEGANTLAGFNVSTPFSVADQFTFSFPYLDQAHFKIKVKTDTELDSSHYEFVSDYLIQLTQVGVDYLNAIYTSGTVDIIISRETKLDTRLVDFQDGANLTAAELDLQANQTFYLMQEAYDVFLVGSLQSNPVSGEITASGAEIINVGDATSLFNAANLNVVLKNVVTPTYEEFSDYRTGRLVFDASGNLFRATINILEAPALMNMDDWDVVLTVAQLAQIDINSNAITAHSALNDAHQNADTEASLELWAATASNGEHAYAIDTKKYYGVQDGSLVSFGGGGTDTDIEQSLHGFTIGMGVFHNGTNWQKAKSDLGDTLATFCVVKVKDSNNFVASNFGRVRADTHGFIVGGYYYQSADVAGSAIPSEPSAGYSSPLFYVEDANTLQVFVYRPSPIGDIGDPEESMVRYVDGDSYTVDNIVWREADNRIYRCITSNSDVLFTLSNWAELSAAESLNLVALQGEVDLNTAKISYDAATAVALNTAKISYTEALVVAANTAKISYTDALAVAANTSKISYTDALAVALNTAKVTYDDQVAVALNTAKISYTDSLAVAANTAKISYTDALAVAANTAKISYDDALVVAANAAHVLSTLNPHSVTASQVGLGSVDNTSDLDKPVSTAQAVAIAANSETLTSISIAANTLTYVAEDGLSTSLDLSLYLDDTNLARLVSGTLNATTGVATFTRDDLSTFTLDLSSLIDIETVSTLVELNGVFTYTDESAVQTVIDISGFETSLQLNARDVANRSRANHTGTQLAATISDFGASILGSILTGISFISSLPVLATDSILVAIGKLQAQNTMAAVEWLQTCNNTPQTTDVAAYVPIILDADVDSFNDTLFTRIGNTVIRSNFNGFLTMQYAIAVVPTTNDRGVDIIANKNGISIIQGASIGTNAGSAIAGRKNLISRQFKVSCSVNDLFDVSFASPELNLLTINAGDAVVAVASVKVLS